MRKFFMANPSTHTSLQPACDQSRISLSKPVLLFREKIPATWFEKIIADIPAMLIDHAHLERKAATSAINLEKYRHTLCHVHTLNAIAIEELEHFELVLQLLEKRGYKLRFTPQSPWITGLMRAIRHGVDEQVIDHLIVASLIEGRSCEKFQILRDRLPSHDTELAEFYGSLVASEGNHYATFWLMACEVNNAEAHTRLDYFLDH
ncbi:MAG: tRNA isopentenyl-2-thiomethyl-A-37 hydroxylase MiaE [Verrucomicrobiia bacterium]